MLVGLLYDCICFIYLSNVVIFVSYLYLYLSLLFVFVQFMQFAISRRWPALGQTCGAKVQVADFRALTQLLTDRRATLKVKAGAVFLKTGGKRNWEQCQKESDTCILCLTWKYSADAERPAGRLDSAVAAVVAFQQHQGIENSSSSNNNTQQKRFEGKENQQNCQTDQTKAVVAFQQHSFKISSNKNTQQKI